MSPNATLFNPPIPQHSKQPIFWTGLRGCADALALANAIRTENRLFVIVTPDNHSAWRLEQAVAFFLNGEQPLLHFPDWETLPYDLFSPLPEIISERLRILALLADVKRGALVLSVQTLMQRLAPREFIFCGAVSLSVGNVVVDDIKNTLDSGGYQRVSEVVAHAEYALHGTVLDVFAMGETLPFRLELSTDMPPRVLSIRQFDPDNQRSLATVQSVQCLPAREFPFNKETIAQFKTAFQVHFPDTSLGHPFYVDVSSGITPNGCEYYLPLFVSHTTTLFDYLPPASVMVLTDTVQQAANAFFSEACERFEQRRASRPLLKPALLFLSPDELTAKITAYPQLFLVPTRQRGNELSTAPAVQDAERLGLHSHAERGNEAVNFSSIVPTRQHENEVNFPCQPLPDFSHAPQDLAVFVKNFDGKLLLVAESAGYREMLIDKCRAQKISLKQVDSWQGFLNSKQSPCIAVAPLESGLLLDNLAIISESQLLGEKAPQQRKRRRTSRDVNAFIDNLNELTVGAPVVHIEHGVGRYLGLQTLQVGGVTGEFLMLGYAGDDKLYVPVASLAVISRYTGMSPETAPLHKLGNDQWAKAKKKALARIHDVAVELLEIHAKRALRERETQMVWRDESLAEYQAFADAFPFEETPDQQSAIDSIIADFNRGQPMDRVICGDVGFGKTEVAMRAAFLAVQSGKQVAVLVPTTLLAQQHYNNFSDRFADQPVRIELLSRFVTPKQQREIASELADGKVDIVIGTHKLLSGELHYKALGLVVIDEEHRFGVRQKEHFKKLRSEVDLLTLTATPIPRTLNMAMSGLRDLSIIASPPPNRHVIKTFINEWQDEQIKEACQREIKRGGQVFFLHNDIKSMDKMAREIHRLVPEARLEIAHGQMHGKELERIMLDFYHQRFNVLLSTTIIESGIDIPSANTIIINRADKLGLAPLHQLRGRVGRSHHRAYAYFIVPPKALMTADAVKRLEAIEAAGDLGAGFMLSSHDMEIRGAGELLGDEQSGQIQEIGFTLYSELLEQTVNALKSGKQPELNAPLKKGVEVDLQVSALIPEDYLFDIHARLVLYKRIASASDTEQLRDLQIEMIDRFGLLPDAVKNLFAIAELKQRAEPLGIKKIEAGAAGGRLIFTAEPTINAEQLIHLIQSQSQVYKLDGMDKLRFVKPFLDTNDKVAFIRELLGTLAG